MFSGESRRRLRLGVTFAIGISLAACTGSPSVPGTASVPSVPSSSQTDSSAGGHQVPSTAHDGSTVVPTSDISSCDLLAPARIRDVLGDAAATLQPGEPSGTIDQNGVRRESCVYPLDAGLTTTHAVVLEVTTYASAEGLRAGNPFALMRDPVEVAGLPGEARFSKVELSGSTEYVLAIATGPKLTRLIVSQPNSSWSSTDAVAALNQLAISIQS